MILIALCDMEQISQHRVEDFLDGLRGLPTMPDVYFKVRNAIEDPAVSLESVAEVIRLDPVLNVSLLRLANSPFFGFKQKIHSVHQAILMIGLREIYSLVLSVLVLGLFPMKMDSRRALYLQGIWKHCLAVGCIAREFSLVLKIGNPESLFVGGLLHDIGMIIELLYLNDDFDHLYAMSQREESFFVESEARTLGFTHAEVGRVVLEKWNLPDDLIMSSAFHYAPGLCPSREDRQQVTMVHLADSLARAMQLGFSGDPWVSPVDMESFSMLSGIQNVVNSHFIELVLQRFEESVSILIPSQGGQSMSDVDLLWWPQPRTIDEIDPYIDHLLSKAGDNLWSKLLRPLLRKYWEDKINMSSSLGSTEKL